MTCYHNLVVLLLTLSIICVSGNGGISVELIHRDSPNSPLYNPNETPFQRLTNSIHRSFNRVNHFHQRKLEETPYPQEEITNADGDFIIKFSIGSNHSFQMGLVDTISNMIWLQCQQCDNCYKQDFPIFDPSTSTTYEPVPCSSDACGAVPNRYCTENICQYQMKYVSGAVSSGGVARETLSLSSNDPNKFISFPKVLFGCGHVNFGITSSSFSGIIGLGPGAFSLTSQLSNSLLNKFSYCFVPAYASNNISILNFGDHALVSGPGTVSTPLKYGPNGDLYYLNLEGISVGGGKRIEVEVEAEAEANDQGNVIIDSGTTLTFLPEGLYTGLESEIASVIKLERVPSPVSSLKLCYKSPPNAIEAPILTAHFTGADVVLNRENTFITVEDDVVCLAIAPSTSSYVYGNLAMRNFLIGIDRNTNVVSFMPTDCSKR
ncbi:PREDICTED: aspartic proteinase CDR1-like [Lupinus angustifolius]|uniref:aspartic proteinase CDR1-like n=1 Tax=Lupinus angustifolius TaxID=3871 RepID=UPI00092EFC4A|nr:PREDICTED: aspartic proteinase CDR1-like [Lupinus angustifolius]